MTVRITIYGRALPGRMFLSNGVPLSNVHVAVQVGKDPVGLVLQSFAFVLVVVAAALTPAPLRAAKTAA